MSLSNHDSHQSNLTGKVIMGISSPGPDEMSIQEIEGKRQLLWDDATDAEYMDRVKAKAKEKAKEIMIMAELEAEALRATAKHEGYAEGLAAAQADLQAHTDAMSAEVENLLQQIGAHGKDIFEQRRQDIISLIKLAVEKTLNIEMSESRKTSMEALMGEALERLESQRQLVIRITPEDAADLEAFLGTIQQRNPALEYWTVKGDPSLQKGGVVVENADGKVDNSVASRWNGVEPILDRLAEQLTAEKTEG